MVKLIKNKFATIIIYKEKSILYIDFKCEGNEQDIEDFYSEISSIYNKREIKNTKFNLVINTKNIISIPGCLEQIPKFFGFFDNNEKTSKLTKKISVVVNSQLIISTLEHFFNISPPVIKTGFFNEEKDAFKSSTITKNKINNKSNS